VIPLGGKRGLSRGVAEQEARRLDALVGVQRQALLTHVRQLAYSAAAAARRVELRDRLSQLATETVAVTRQLYNIGSVDQPDVLQAETEADLARLAAEEARSDQLRIWRMLAAAVDKPGLPLQALALDLDGPLPTIDLDVQRERLVRDSAEMKVVSALIDREEAALKRAQREPAPDLFLRGAPLYNREPRETASRQAGWETSIEVGVRVPLFDRNRGAIDGAATDAAVARHASERAKLDLESRLADAFGDYAGARRRAEVLKGEALPRAERAFEMYRARYKEMAAPYPRVLTAQQTLIELSVAYLDAVEVAWRSAALIQGTLVPPRAGMER
jgi:cobalt-zinc-cadmium efflux system outer membrane protein